MEFSVKFSALSQFCDNVQTGKKLPSAEFLFSNFVSCNLLLISQFLDLLKVVVFT